MGLSISKSMIELLAPSELKDVEIHSELGKGTSFSFFISNRTKSKILQNKLSSDAITEVNEAEEFSLMNIPSRILDKKCSKKQEIYKKSASLVYWDNESNSSISKERSQNCNCCKIIIIDDNYFNLLALSELLKSYKLISVLARSGEEGIEMINSKKKDLCCKNYSVILLDIEMPIMDGYEVCCKVKEIYKKEFKYIVVACTAVLDDEVIFNCRLAGFDYFIEKPINIDKLTDILKKEKILFN